MYVCVWRFNWPCLWYWNVKDFSVYRSIEPIPIWSVSPLLSLGLYLIQWRKIGPENIFIRIKFMAAFFEGTPSAIFMYNLRVLVWNFQWGLIIQEIDFQIWSCGVYGCATEFIHLFLNIWEQQWFKVMNDRRRSVFEYSVLMGKRAVEANVIGHGFESCSWQQ